MDDSKVLINENNDTLTISFNNFLTIYHYFIGIFKIIFKKLFETD